MFAEIDSSVAVSRLMMGEQAGTTDWVEIEARARERGLGDCPVCLGPLVTARGAEGLVLLSCSHVFHDKCLASFERFSIALTCKCPVCRSAYTKRPMGCGGDAAGVGGDGAGCSPCQVTCQECDPTVPSAPLAPAAGGSRGGSSSSAAAQGPGAGGRGARGGGRGRGGVPGAGPASTGRARGAGRGRKKLTIIRLQILTSKRNPRII